MGEPDRPCEYCGTMLDEHGAEISDVPAAGPLVTHFTTVCRERVRAALNAEKAAHTKTLARLKIAENVFRFSSTGAAQDYWKRYGVVTAEDGQ